ncbi:MAG: hypothetical protein CM15mP47_4360 [Methanobacteriota archaeon]|nr:MAG: hypothetical protein CM15mP47_4360 [Euryarchaeota archaeon]
MNSFSFSKNHFKHSGGVAASQTSRLPKPRKGSSFPILLNPAPLHASHLPPFTLKLNVRGCNPVPLIEIVWGIISLSHPNTFLYMWVDLSGGSTNWGFSMMIVFSIFSQTLRLTCVFRGMCLRCVKFSERGGAKNT